MAAAKGWGGWTGPLERYSKPPSNQKALPNSLFPTEGGERMDEAREWVRENPAAWEWMVAQAAEECSQGGYTSIKRLAAGARFQFRVHVNDKLTSSLARIMLEEHPGIRLKVRRSMADAYTTATL